MTEDLKKKFAKFLIVITTGLIIFSLAYIVKETNHDCTGDNDCPICVRIEQCINNFRTLGTSGEIKSDIFISGNFFIQEIFIYVCLIVPFTLVNCKVRLDD